jgi:serine/threonine protein kinase
LRVGEVAEILRQAARGLNAAHKLGIISRGLKPNNIFLTYPEGEAVAPASPVSGVSDFGSAMVRSDRIRIRTDGPHRSP